MRSTDITIEHGTHLCLIGTIAVVILALLEASGMPLIEGVAVVFCWTGLI